MKQSVPVKAFSMILIMIILIAMWPATARAEGIDASTADSSGVTYTAAAQPVKSITLNVSAYTIPLGKTYTVKVKEIAPANASNKSVKWRSSNPNVATITSGGVVQGLARGMTTITATAQDGSGIVGSCQIYVGNRVTQIKLDITKKTFSKPGAIHALKATISPDTAVHKGISWKSGDKGIATVDSKGVISAVGPGTTIITATAKDGSGIKAECTITCQFTEGDARVYKNIQKIYVKVGTDLHANYKWVVNNLSYVRRNGHPDIPKGYTREQWYAVEGMEVRKGNCYTYAAAFAQLAKGLGYDATYIEGTVNGRNGSQVPHGFVIVKIDGARYICDPELESVGSRNLYMQPIANPKAKYNW